MNLIRYFPIEPKINFVAKRWVFHAISIFLVLGSVALYLTRDLNFGVDFKGGIVMEVQTDGPAKLDDMRRALNSLNLGDVTLQQFGEDDVVLINVPRQEGDDSAQQTAIELVKTTLGQNVVEYRRTESVGPKVGEELRMGAIIATVLSLMGIAIYVWFRFDMNFAWAALIALTHDVIATVGFYALTQYQFDLSTLAAVLTVAGYSINDTVVIYDRVREELRRYKKTPVPEVLNKAMNATLSRTTLTSLTTLLALFGLFFLGGEVIEGFAAGIIFGILVGTFSSWGVAVPLLLFTNLRAGAAAEAPKVKEPAAKGA